MTWMTTQRITGKCTAHWCSAPMVARRTKLNGVPYLCTIKHGAFIRCFVLELNICKSQLREPVARRLGLLAGTFEDGSLSIYTVPYPPSVTSAGHDASLPVYGAQLVSLLHSNNLF